MAASVGTVTKVWDISQATGGRESLTFGGHEYRLGFCFIAVNHNDQANAYAQVDGCTVDCTAAIAAASRDGKTRLVISGTVVEAGLDDGVITVGGPITCTAPGTLHMHLLAEDTTTEKNDGAWAAASTWTKDVVYVVTYLQLEV